jgi:biopolymer transport protein TolR
MAESVSSGGGGKTPSAKADINITPLVDVMLVLLIVFMVAAPMLEQGVEINLPQAAAESIEPPPKDKTIIKLAVDRDQRIILSYVIPNENPSSGKVIPPAELGNMMKSIASNPGTVEVNVEADASLQYGYLAKVMATVRRSGIKKVNLITQPTEDQSM